MVEFNYQTDFKLENDVAYAKWLEEVALSEAKSIGEISYVFCDDDFLHKINLEYLNHDTLTDIITFDYCDEDFLNGEIYISVDRVRENAGAFSVDFNTELHRVISHGLLHLCGYPDKTDEESKLMRSKEDEKMNMFHVKQ
ncbi:MAG: rRNA maturation RNase YbeY [Nonlabens sp.]|uniref:rRNA maturation RNase YbeY n=1 Tax=Nonlabens sp. TaxID=1888209 RepID=UPI003EF31951